MSIITKLLGANRLLKRLDPSDLSRLKPGLKEISLKRGTVLHHAGAPIEHVYFPISGMISILVMMSTGDAIEAATIGKEGVVGASVAHNGSQAAGQAIVQIAGSALQVQGLKFVDQYKASMPFSILMNKFQTVILLQAQQSAACHALHSVQARLARLLLQSQDATETDFIPLTQEYLSHMLGVQRNSVSLCAHAFQNAGLIRYSRGEITILNRSGLKDSACECYEVVREHIYKVAPPFNSRPNSTSRKSKTVAGSDVLQIA